MLKFESLVLALLVGVAPTAIAEGVGNATNPAPVPAATQKGRVLTQQGRVVDESAAAEPKSVDPKGAQPEGNVAKTQHDMSKSSIGNIKAREAAAGAPGGSVPPNGTPGSAASEGALTMGRDKLKGTTKTTKPVAAGQAAPDVDVSTPKVGQAGSL